MPSWLPRAAVEAVLIVFAVVLGFIVNEWREDIAAQRASDIALDRIQQEMQGNLESMERVVGYHREVQQNIASVLAEIEGGDRQAEGVFFELLPELMPRGLNPPRLSSVAWDYAQTRGELDNVEYALIADIAEVYRLHADCPESVWRLIAERLYDDRGGLSEAPLRPRLMQLQLSFSELAAQETYVISEYQSVLETLEN